MLPVTAETRQQREQEVRRLFRHQRLSLVVIAVVFSLAWFYLTIAPERPARALMEFRQAQPAGETALCPGDTLRYDIALDVSGPGVFDLDVAVWRVTPPATVLFSSTRRLVFQEQADYSLERAWTIPPFYSSPTDGSPERWAAGHYERRHAISTTSRSTEPSIVVIPFSIKDSCQ